MMSRLFRSAAVLVLPLLLAACDFGTSGTSLAGRFVGTGGYSSVDVEMELTVEDGHGGEVSGEALYREIQDTNSFTLTGDFEGNVAGDRITIVLDVSDGSTAVSLPFSGRLNDDRDEIDGTVYGFNVISMTLELDG